MKNFFKYYFYFLGAMLLFALLINITDSTDDLELSYAAKHAAPATTAKKTDKGTEALARVLYIKLELDFLKKATKNIVTTQRDLDYYQQSVKKLYKAIEEHNQDEKWNDKIKTLIKDRLNIIQKNKLRYDKILALLKNKKLDSAIKLSGFKTAQEFLIKVMKEKQTEATIMLIDMVDLTEDNYKNDETPLILATEMHDYMKVLDKLLTKTFSLTNYKSISSLMRVLKDYKVQVCINEQDFQRAGVITSFLDKNAKTNYMYKVKEKSKNILKSIELLASKEYDLQRLDLKFLYQRSIKHGCQKLFVKLINDNKGKLLKNTSLTVREPFTSLKVKYIDAKYTPLEYAQKYNRTKIIKLLNKDLNKVIKK